MPPPAKLLMPSVFNRLLDRTMIESGQRGYTLEEMTDAVRADLEELLNTQCTGLAVNGALFPEVRKSIVMYGVPDLITFDSSFGPDTDALSKTLTELINRFEPRLRHVRISWMPHADKDDRHVSLRIEAELALNPAPEVGFVTVVEISTGQTSVQTSGPGRP